jgi:hypothetical protein
MRLAAAATAALLFLLVLASAAAADREQVKLTRSGQRAAHTAVLKRSDLHGAWTGTAKKPVINSEIGCPGFHPKQSDLVVVGAAETDWRSAHAHFDSTAQVLKTPRMVQLDWKRTVRAPKVLPCLHRNVLMSLASTERLSFVTRLPVKHFAPFVHLYRSVVVVGPPKKRVPILIDSLLIGKGRTEITLTTTALYSARHSVMRTELRLGRALARRAR